MQIPFGEIRSLDRDSDSAVKIELADGRHLQLTASADNGVFVDDSRFGRVLVGWQAVQHIDFSSPRDSPAYGDFPPGRPLAGSVTDRAGKSYHGRLVFDLDEAETWEFLNGNHLTQRRTKPQWPVRDDDPGSIQYSIPIPFVAAVVPIDGESARLLLHDGREITLEGETDVGEWNGGMLIYESRHGEAGIHRMEERPARGLRKMIRGRRPQVGGRRRATRLRPWASEGHSAMIRFRRTQCNGIHEVRIVPGAAPPSASSSCRLERRACDLVESHELGRSSRRACSSGTNLEIGHVRFA